MTLDDLLDFCSAEALASKFEPTESAVWRKLCRQYSKKFHTPLPQVMSLNPEEVAINVFEENLEELDTEEHLEQLLDLIYTLEDPEYARQKEEELGQFIKDTERQEKERIRAGKPIHPGMVSDSSPRKLVSKKEATRESSLPTGGIVNLSYLEDDSNER
jgi:hypothetical protein